MSQLQNRKPEFVPDKAKWRIAATVAAVAGIFTLVLAALLIINYVQIQATKPLDNPELLKLREQLAASSEQDDALVNQIRALDLLVRKAFFTSQAQLRIGGRLLLAGAIVFLAAFRLAARWNPKTPVPGGAPDSAAMSHRTAPVAAAPKTTTSKAIEANLQYVTTSFLSSVLRPLQMLPPLARRSTLSKTWGDL